LDPRDPGKRRGRLQETEADVSYTRRFGEIGKDSIAFAGGKGANLGEMSRAALPVPPAS